MDHDRRRPKGNSGEAAGIARVRLGSDPAVRYDSRVEPGSLTLQPIGVVRSPFSERVDAPRQPRAAEGVRGSIELFAGRHFEDALSDLDRWEYIWVLFWFHLNDGWRPKVQPPRSRVRRGAFATRAPHRPNPLGLSVVRLERVEGLRLDIANVDMLDGTPVLDIKPYVAYTDAIAEAGSGWLDGEATTAPDDPLEHWKVEIDELAGAQLEFLEREHGIELQGRVVETLSLGPLPHAYRRIKREGDGLRLAIKEWRVHFRVEGRRVRVLGVSSGYRPAQLAGSDPGLDVHRAFVEKFGQR